MTSRNARVARAPRTAGRVLDGKAVIVIIDSRELHTLNAVGTFIWEALENDRVMTVMELVDAVADEFEVEHRVAERDVARFVDSMHTLRALRLEEEGS